MNTEAQSRGMPLRSLRAILQQTVLFHAELFALWDDLPAPDSPRSLLVAGYCEIVRQHAVAQALLADAEIDVSATTLGVHPRFRGHLQEGRSRP